MAFSPGAGGGAVISMRVEDAAASRKDIESVGDSLKRLNEGNFQKLSGQVSAIQTKIGGLRDTLTSLAQVSVAGFTVGAFTEMIHGAIEAADSLNDLKKSTGIAVADLAGLKLAAQQSGGDLEGIAASINKLSVAMGKDGERFAKLGVTAKDPIEAFKQLADVFSAIDDPQTRAALGAEALGKSWASAAPLLMEGSQNIGEMVAKGRELSGVTQDMADKADEFNDKLAELQTAANGAKMKLADEMLPALTEVAKAVTTAYEQSGKLTAAWVALGALGKFAFTDEFSSTQVKLKNLRAELEYVQRDLVLAKDAPAVGFLGRWLLGDSEEKLQARVAALQAQIAALEQSAQPPAPKPDAPGAGGKEAKEAAAKAAEFLRLQEEARKKAEEEARKTAALFAELSGLSGSFADDWKRLGDAYTSGKVSLDQLIKAQAELLAKQPAMRAAADAEIKAKKELADFQKQYSEGLAAGSKILSKSIEDAVEEAEKNEELARTFGMSKAAIEALELARLEEQLAQRSSLGLTLDEIETLEKLIDAKKRSARALGDLDSKEANKRAADDLTAEYKRSAEQIGQSLTDNIMRGGKSAADYLQDLFRTLVLRPILAPIGNAVGGAVSSLTMPGMAQAAGDSAGGGSAAGSMLGSAAGSLFGAGGMAGSLAAGAGWLTGATTLGGSLTAGASLIGTGSLAGIASGMGMIAGALGPIALGLAGAYALYKAVDHSGTPHTGGAASASSAGVSTIAAESLHFEKTATSASTEQWVAGLAQGIVSILDSTALAFGKTAGYTAATAFADDSSKDGAWGGLVISKLGDKLIDWQDSRGNGRWAPKLFADGDAGQKQYLAALSADVRTALDGIGLPSWAQKMLDGLGKDAGLDEMAKVIDAINATQTALKAMGDQLVGFSSLSEGAVSALMAAAGGIQNLAAGASAYYDNFYSDTEKNASLVKQVGDTLHAVGLQMPATRDEFRALVEAQMALGEAGAPAVAVLFKNAAAFAQLHPLIEQTTDAVVDQAKAYQDAASGLLGNVDTAFSVLQSVVAREKTALQARIDAEAAAVANLKSLSDTLHAALDSMRGPEAGALERQAAQAQIRSALAVSKAGGPLPDADSLKQALGTLAQDASGQFATYADYLRDAYATRNDVAGLAKVSDDALSVEQKTLATLQDQLEGLDALLADQQAKMDLLKGQSTTLLSIDDAVRALTSAILAAQNNPVVGATQAVNGAYQSALGRAPDAAGLAFWQKQAANGTPVDAIVKDITGSPEATIRGMYQTMLGRPVDPAGMAFWMNQVSHGVSLADIGNALAGSDEARRLHPFAVGTNYVPETMPALVHEGERIIPAADNRALLARLASPAQNSEVLVQELRALRAEVEQLRRDNSAENLAIAKHSMKSASALEDAVTGNRPLATVAGS